MLYYRNIASLNSLAMHDEGNDPSRRATKGNSSPALTRNWAVAGAAGSGGEGVG